MSGDPPVEILSVFVHVYDADGTAEISDLWIISDEYELVWHLEENRWETHETGDALWIGSSALGMPGGAPFPRGSLRVLVADLSGRESESVFRMPSSAREISAGARPRIELQDGLESVHVAGRETFLVRFSAGDDEPARYRVSEGLLSGKDLRLIAQGEWFLVTGVGEPVTVLTPAGSAFPEN